MGKVLLSMFLLSKLLGKIYFLETFESLDNWVIAKSKEGRFGLVAEEWGLDTSSTRLKTLNDNEYYLMSAKTNESLDNSDKPLVFLITVKHEQGPGCAGGYLKLLSNLESQENFNEESEYEIMFGPDICSSTRKVQAILRHDSTNLEIEPEVGIPADKFTHQYVLLLNPDDTFEIIVDRKISKSGNIVDY